MRRSDRLSRFDALWIGEPNTGCWLWLGSLNHNGYGTGSMGGESYRAHRLSHELFKGPIPEYMQIDHLCRVRCCVNHEHLEAVPQRENNRRSLSLTAMQARQTHCIRGHEFTPANTIRNGGHRRCRECRRTAYA